MDWLDAILKVAMVVTTGGISIKFAVDQKNSKNGHRPVNHQELAEHARGCSGDLHDRITKNHEEVLREIGMVKGVCERLDERTKK